MSRGRQKKENNARIYFIKNTLQNRLNKLKSHNLDTEDKIKNAIDNLEKDVVYSPTLTISFADCLPSGLRYKNAMPKGYIQALKNLKIKLENIDKIHADSSLELDSSFTVEFDSDSDFTEELDEDYSLEMVDNTEIELNLATEKNINESIEIDANLATVVESKPTKIVDLADSSESLTILEQSEPSVSRKKTQPTKALHEIPLFEDTQLIDWPTDGRTNQLSRLVIAISRGVNQDGKVKFNTIDEIFTHIVAIWSLAKLPFPSIANKEFFTRFYWPLIKEAIVKYSELEGLRNFSSDLDEGTVDGRYLLNVFEQYLDKKIPIPQEKTTNAKPVKKQRSSDLERVNNSYDALSVANLVGDKKKEFTKFAIQTHVEAAQAGTTNIFVGRLFVGSGYSGMTLMSTDPSVPESSRQAFQQLQSYVAGSEEEQPLYLATLLISEHETGHWTRAEHRAEQEHSLLEVPGNANAGDFIPRSHSIGRTVRTNTRHLFYANNVNMALKDTPPPLFGVVVNKMERREKHLDDWSEQANSFDYRLEVIITNEFGSNKAFIYAHSIDFALGMGEGQNISFENALEYECSMSKKVVEPDSEVDPLKSKESSSKTEAKKILKDCSTFDSIKGYTPIIHGNDFDLSDREKQSVSAKKNRRVVVIGGAGGAATAYRISVLGCDSQGYRLQNENREFLQEGVRLSLNKNVKIFARGIVSYRNLAVQATESFEYAKENNDLYEGHMLIGIKVENGKVILKFHNKKGAIQLTKEEAENCNRLGKEIVEDNKQFYLLNPHIEVCDQLISGMGQDASKIRQLVFNDLDENDLQVVRGHDGHFVCLETKCQQIRFHGAMAGTLSTKFASDLSASLEKSHLPKNSNDQNIMPCVLSKLFSFFSASETRGNRLSFNVNTCFLARGDLRKSPSEFHHFLVRAGLNNSEIEGFTNFLLLKRAIDETGAGVSCENLTQYIKDAGFSDRIQVVSSCSIISVKDLATINNTRSFV